MLENKNTGVAFVSTLAILLFSVTAADASGTYTGRPPRPPSSVDRASYELGKEIFAGRFATGSRVSHATDQRAELEDLHDRLPLKARSRAQFLEYEGQLSDAQLDALRYYLKKRYKVQ